MQSKKTRHISTVRLVGVCAGFVSGACGGAAARSQISDSKVRQKSVQVSRKSVKVQCPRVARPQSSPVAPSRPQPPPVVPSVSPQCPSRWPPVSPSVAPSVPSQCPPRPQCVPVPEPARVRLASQQPPNRNRRSQPAQYSTTTTH